MNYLEATLVSNEQDVYLLRFMTPIQPIWKINVIMYIFLTSFLLVSGLSITQSPSFEP